MVKLTLDLVEGGSISLERQGEFLVIAHIKDKKETVLGLLRKTDFGHLKSFMENEIFNQLQTAIAQPVFPFGNNPGDYIRNLVREIKKEMDRDEDEPPYPPEEK